MTFDRRPKIAPSILSADFARLGEECRAIESQGADWVHVDVMDGHFVPNITIGPAVCAAIRPHVKGVLDVHLMIAPADPYIAAFAEAGADVITVHPEAGPHVHRTLQAIRVHGRKAGVSLNPGTPLSAVEHLLDRIDLALVMSVNPGFGGQAFIGEMLPKVAALREMVGEREIHIQVDGGVTASNAGELVRRGADVLVAGSAVFSGGSVEDAEVYGRNISSLREAAEAGL